MPYCGTFRCQWCGAPATRTVEIEPEVKKKGELVTRARIAYACDEDSRRVLSQEGPRPGRRGRKTPGQLGIYMGGG
jgi:hypothetical protein